MPLSLHPLTAGDFTPLTPLQYAAFHPVEKLHMLIYPSPTPPNPEIYARTVARRLKSFGKDEWEWVKVVDDTTCEIVAAVKWAFYTTHDPHRWLPTDPTWILPSERGRGNAGLGVEDRSYVTWVLSQVDSRRGKILTGPAAVLDLCFTAPAHQGRGAGKMLVRWGTERADALGIRCFVESSEEGLGLYRACGFVERERVWLEGGKVKDEWKDYGSIGYSWMEREVGGGDAVGKDGHS